MFVYGVTAHPNWSWLAGESICQPMVVHPSRATTRHAGHNSHIHGPADHRCHCQPERKQTQGEYG